MNVPVIKTQSLYSQKDRPIIAAYSQLPLFGMTDLMKLKGLLSQNYPPRLLLSAMGLMLTGDRQHT